MNIKCLFYRREIQQINAIHTIDFTIDSYKFTAVSTGLTSRDLYVAVKRENSAMIYRLETKPFDDGIPDYRRMKPVFITRRKRQVSGNNKLTYCKSSNKYQVIIN